MNQTEVIKLCRMVKASCPSQVFDEFTPEIWGLILGGYRYDDAQAAVLAIVGAPLEQGKSRYVEPGHIVGGIHRIRRGRLEALPVASPPPGLEERDYRAWYTRTRDAIAAGTYTAPTAEPTADPERIAAIVADAKPKCLE